MQRATPEAETTDADSPDRQDAEISAPVPRLRPRPVKSDDHQEDQKDDGRSAPGAAAVTVLSVPGIADARAEDTSAAQQAVQADFGSNQSDADESSAEAKDDNDGHTDGAKNSTDENTEGAKPKGTRAGESGPRWWRVVLQSKLWRVFLRLFIIVAIVATGVILLRIYVVQPYYIPSESMEPTLHGCSGCNNDHILVDKLSYRSHGPDEGDIVVFNRPKGDSAPDNVLIKRVIGLAGDEVQLKKGRVYLNGLSINEPYIDKKCGQEPTRPLTSVSRWRVPRGDVFVLGDNRCNSHDSRAFGPIPISSVVGRAFAISWPVNRIGLL